MSDFTRSITAETYKLKRTPIFWISIIGGVTSALIVFLLFFVLIDEFVEFNTSPWARYYGLSYGVMSLLLLVPYIILVCSTMVQSEYNSNAWKYLYSLPLAKGNIYFSKLAVAIGLIALTLFVFFATTLVGGFVLGMLRPEYEFSQYSPRIGEWAMMVTHSFIAILGVTALQYWLSIRWRNYIIPIGIGMMGFVMSVLIVDEQRVAKFFPYCYSMLLSNNQNGMENFGGDNWIGGLMTVEWASIFFFMLFAAVGFYEQKVRNVK